MVTIITGIICLIVGAGVGVGIMALCFVANECDKSEEKLTKHTDDKTES